MIILQADITAFGKLQEKEIALRPGMNVITGDNESGKTTIAAFLKAMLFGTGEDYERWFPKEASGAYGGGLKVLSDGAFYRIERSFLKTAPRLTVTKLSDGSPVEDPESWLVKARGALTEYDYVSTGFIPQGALIKEIGSKEVTPEKAEEISKEAEIRFRYEKAEARLSAKKNELMKQVDPALETRMAENEALLKEKKTEKGMLSAQLSETKKELGEAEEKLKRDTVSAGKEDDARVREMKETIQNTKERLSASVRKTSKKHRAGAVFGTVFLVTGFLLAAAALFYMLSEKVESFRVLLTPETEEEIICAAGFAGAVFFFILGLVFAIVNSANRSRAKKMLKNQENLRSAAESAEKEYQDYLDTRKKPENAADPEGLRESRITALREKAVSLTEQSAEKETGIAALLSEQVLNEKKLAGQKAALKEISAIELALRSLNHLTEETSGQTAADHLSLRATDYFDRIDSGKALKICLNPEGSLSVVSDGLEKSVTSLSQGTAEEVVLAARLALFEEKDPGKKLPVILDDIFPGFDENRMNAAMNLLRSLGRQAVLLSCQTRERQKL